MDVDEVFLSVGSTVGLLRDSKGPCAFLLLSPQRWVQRPPLEGMQGIYWLVWFLPQRRDVPRELDEPRYEDGTELSYPGDLLANLRAGVFHRVARGALVFDWVVEESEIRAAFDVVCGTQTPTIPALRDRRWAAFQGAAGRLSNGSQSVGTIRIKVQHRLTPWTWPPPVAFVDWSIWWDADSQARRFFTDGTVGRGDRLLKECESGKISIWGEEYAVQWGTS